MFFKTSFDTYPPRIAAISQKSSPQRNVNLDNRDSPSSQIYTISTPTSSSCAPDSSIMIASFGCQLPNLTLATASTTPSINSLVIDDNIITGRILSKILEKEFGHKVTCLESGEAALEVLSQEVFDVCFLDIDMPGINGMETTLAIRKHSLDSGAGCGVGCGAETVTPDAPDVGVVMAAKQILDRNRLIPIVAYTTNEWSQRFLDCGMNGFLAKPATLESLRAELERIF